MVANPLFILALLTGLNLLNYLDRFLLAAVLPRVIDELSLSNLLAGGMATVFLVGYFLTSPLFGAAGDRMPRKRLIAFGVFLWSLATIASGLARNAHELLIARALVGVGEASYATLAPTIIDDLAPPDKRGRWLAIFYLATPVGSALGYLIGGAIEQHHGWRSVFFVGGGPGVVLALLCLLIREPKRTAPRPPKLTESIKLLGKSPLYVQCVAGYCASTFAVGGFAFWAPTYLNRLYKLDLDRANFLFGATTVVAGAIGTFIGGWLGDRRARQIGGDPDEATARGNLWVCSISGWLAFPLATLAVLSNTPTMFFVAMGLCELNLFMASSPVNAVILRGVPSAVRASAMAASIFAIHLFGDLWSPPVVGALTDRMPMQHAMLILPAAVLLSAVLWTWWGKPRQPAASVGG